jgi:hypothetical protein
LYGEKQFPKNQTIRLVNAVGTSMRLANEYLKGCTEISAAEVKEDIGRLLKLTH